MLTWLALLMLLPIGADLLMHALRLSLPGPVTGFLLLLVWLCWRGAIPGGLDSVSGELMRRIPLFVVPPSVGMLVWRFLERSGPRYSSR
jgi:putative effector of murein hydrolase LrgA (UPF0299 family)